MNKAQRINATIYCVFCILGAIVCIMAHAGSPFTYQGRLGDGGKPANSVYDLTFSLYNAAVNGLTVGPSLTNVSVVVVDGLFVASLDFGDEPFDGSNIWLEVGIRTSGSTVPYEILRPRQAIQNVPYAVHARNAITSAQLKTATNVLQKAVAENLRLQSDVISQLSTALNGAAMVTNGVLIGSRVTNATLQNVLFASDNANSTPGITIQSAGTNDMANVTLQNGWWPSAFNTPVAYFQPVTVGVPMPFDLMPKGEFSADSWMDISDRDINLNNASLWEAVTVRKHADDYAEIGTKTLNGAYRDLYLQSEAGLNGAKLGIGGFNTIVRPKYMTQIRPATEINLGIDASNDGLLIASANDQNSSYNTIRVNASRFFLSSDQYGASLVYFQVRPKTNVNVSIDTVGGNARISAFNESGSANIPIIYQAKSHIFSTDGEFSNTLTFSNSVLSADAARIKAVAVGAGLSVGAEGLGVSQILTVSSTNAGSQPWPAMMVEQRDSIQPPPPSGSVILNKETGQPELTDGNGHWFRFGQRPVLASTEVANTVVTDGVDVLLVKGTGPRNVLLPSPVFNVNRVIEIKDAAFMASSGTITITTPSGKIENGTSLKITIDGGFMRLASDGSNWFRLN